jgi:hypothetical protein
MSSEASQACVDMLRHHARHFGLMRLTALCVKHGEEFVNDRHLTEQVEHCDAVVREVLERMSEAATINEINAEALIRLCEDYLCFADSIINPEDEDDH